MLSKIFFYRFFMVVFLFLALFSLSACGKSEDEETPVIKKKVEIQEIVKQNEANVAFKASGTVVPREYSVIRSLTPGTVRFLAPVGSTIRAGETLFFISDSGIENTYFNASQSLGQTEIIGQQRVRQAELALNSAKARLDLAKSQYQSSLDQSEQSLKIAEDSASLAYNSAYNDLSQMASFFSLGNIEYDNYKSNKEEFYYFKDISAINSGFKIQTIALFPSAIDSFLDFKKSISRQDLVEELEKMHEALLKMKSLTDNTVILLQNSIYDVHFSEAKIASDKVIVMGFQAKINQDIASIIGSINAIVNAKNGQSLSSDQFQAQLDLAEIDYYNSDLALTSAKEGAQLELNIAKNQFDQAAYYYRNLSLPSPFSGTILSHYVGEGEQISVGREILELGNLAIIEINFDLDASFAKAISLNQEVKINGQYKGVITEIQPAGDLRSGKASIKVQSEEANVLVVGSVAEVEFNLFYADVDSIIAPLKSVNIEASGNYVFVIGEEEKVERRQVVLGEVYGDQVSIVSGLEEGDRLILLNGVFISAGEEVEILN